MGCITSKAITRSISIREDMKHGLKSKSRSSSLLWEDLLTSHTSNDHLFAFLRSSNADTSQPNSSDTNANPDQETAPLPQPHSCQFTRSKSCHALREDEMLGENRLDMEDNNGLRSLSFHTVEEYDALLERIRETTSLESPWDNDDDDDDDDDVKLQGSTSLPEDENEEDSVETGWKRKAIRRGLTTLDISPPDFPAISRFKQTRLVQGQIYSPGTYVTPKFGSYNGPATATQPKDESKEDAVFSSELLAAFEDCMQQLQLEEDTILKHMDNSFSLQNQVAMQTNQSCKNNL